MRDKFIACLLSLTLFVSSVIPAGVAFGDPSEELIEELPVEQVEEPSEELIEELPVEQDTVFDKVHRLKDLALELGDNPSLYPDLSLSQEVLSVAETELSVVAVEDESFYQPAVLSDDYGVSTASWTDAEFDKVDSILDYVKSLFNTANRIHDFVSSTLSNISAIYNALIGAYVPSEDYAVGSMAYYIKYSYYMLLELGVYTDSLETYFKSLINIVDGQSDLFTSIDNRLKFTQDGTTYNAGSSLYRIRQYLYWTDDNGTGHTAGSLLYRIRTESMESSDLLASLDARLKTTQDGTVYNAANLLYRIRTESMESSDLLSSLDARLKFTENGTTYNVGSSIYRIRQHLFWTDDNGTGHSAASLLYRIRTESMESSDLLSQIHLLLKDWETEIEVTLPDDFEVNVDLKQDPAIDTDNDFSLLLAIFGALEFAQLASSLDDLGDTMETTFPFCLVPAFVAIFGLLQSEPVAPCFDLPLFDGSGGQYVYTVDLSPFDPVAQAFRFMITIIFSLGLISITRNFIFKGGSSE